ncbi:hypothetical protein CR164_01465 [Prosthecochloris marina]|uniref:Uncharacterized protein n=1 Tax=Prosthecochloris marina TaxID=2017681 RepID=A0A317T944_9CHLB|nr:MULTISPECIES: hypothetical protein [Prosthecochloris]PWW83253.1 hypothetical protein CR164_01465 [Prosthecochloris marina]
MRQLLFVLQLLAAKRPYLLLRTVFAVHPSGVMAFGMIGFFHACILPCLSSLCQIRAGPFF